jgi:hypothetical protein
MGDSTCIFCQGFAADGNVEHMLPESLGGDDHVCLPPGLVCRQCNQYFGAKVEQLALSSAPFLLWRVMLGLPSKKGKPARIKTMWGEFIGGPRPGVLGAGGRSPEFEGKLQRGEITVGRVIASVTEPEAVCRLLLKMAMELIAVTCPDEARSDRFEPLRLAARYPNSGMTWWFFVRDNVPALLETFRAGITPLQWIEGIYLETILVEGVELFHLHLFDISLMAPIDGDVPPPIVCGEPSPLDQVIVVHFGPKRRKAADKVSI